MIRYEKAQLSVFSEIDGEKRSDVKPCGFRMIGSGFELKYSEGSDEMLVRFAEHGLNGGGRAEIERSGGCSGLMVIEPGQTTPCCMHTSLGRLDLRVRGVEVRFKREQSIIEAELHYETKLASSGSRIYYRFRAELEQK